METERDQGVRGKLFTEVVGSVLGRLTKVLVNPTWMWSACIVITITACSSDNTAQHDPMHSRVQGQCGYFGESSSSSFIVWTSRGLAFDDRDFMRIVAEDGSQLRTLARGSVIERAYPTVGIQADASPDGMSIVYSTCEYRTSPLKASNLLRDDDPRAYSYELAVVNVESAHSQRLTHDPYYEVYPSWSPDGSEIAFVANTKRLDGGVRRVEARLYVLDAEATDAAADAWVRGPLGGVALDYPVWSPSGDRVAFAAVPWGGGWALYTMAADGSDLQRVAEAQGGVKPSIGTVSWAPSGQYLAFSRLEGDDLTLYVSASDGGAERLLTRFEGLGAWRLGERIRDVAWSPDGAEILFAIGARDTSDESDYNSVAYTIRPDGSLLRRLHEHAGRSRESPSYRVAWSPDGERIAVRANDYSSGVVRVWTMARDGTDVRALVHQDDDGQLVAANPRQALSPPDVTACSAGLVVANPRENRGLVADCETMLAFRDTLAGGVFLNWSEDLPIEQWPGVSVGGAPPRVWGVSLRGYSLAGTLPAELGSLSELRRLDLWRNRLRGHIPPELGQLAGLRHLDLSHNRLEGHIPAELGELAELQFLGLSNNALSGAIPPTLALLVNLETLNLSDNDLSGRVPKELWELPHLEEVRLAENHVLGGCVPKGFGGLDTYFTDLHRCQFGVGTILGDWRLLVLAVSVLAVSALALVLAFSRRRRRISGGDEDAGETVIWESTLTVKRWGPSSHRLFGFGPLINKGQLDRVSFSQDGVENQVHLLLYEKIDTRRQKTKNLHFQTVNDLAAGSYILHLGGEAFAFEASDTENTFSFPDVSLSWRSGNKLEVSLVHRPAASRESPQSAVNHP